MAFTTQPSNATSQAYPIYSPVFYQTSIAKASSSTETNVQYAKVYITLNGSTLTTPIRGQDVVLTYYATSVGATSTFDIDIHNILIDHINKTDSLPQSFLNDTDISEDCTNQYATVSILVEYYYIDSSTGNDVLTHYTGNDDTSNTIFVVDAIVQPNLYPQLGFIFGSSQANYVTMSDSMPFLTVAPDGLEVRPSDRAFLSFISDETARPNVKAEVVWTNKNGTTGSGQFTSIPEVNSTDRKVITIASGPKQIETFSTDIGFSSGDSFVASDVSYYRIRILDTDGVSTPAGDYLTASRTYNISDNAALCGGDSDDAVVRMHFLNELGGCDSVTLVGKLERQQNVKSKNVQKARSSTFNFEDVSRRKYEQNIEEIYKFKGADYFSNVELEWLRQLYASAFVTIDKNIDGIIYHIPVLLTDSKQIVFSSEEDNNMEFEYTLNYNLKTRR